MIHYFAPFYLFYLFEIFVVPWRAFPNSIFEREGAFQLRSSTVPFSSVVFPPFSCFIILYYVCPFVASTYAENSHIVLSSRYYKAFIFNLLCVLISFLHRYSSMFWIFVSHWEFLQWEIPLSPWKTSCNGVALPNLNYLLV